MSANDEPTAETELVAHQQRIAIAHAEAKLAITKAQGALTRLAVELHDGAAGAWRLAQLAGDRGVEMSAWVDRARDEGCRGLTRAHERQIAADSRKLGGA